MMKEEFEGLAGYQVSYADYVKVIEPMYLATEMSKQDFVKCLNRGRFALRSKAQIYSRMKALALEMLEAYTVRQHEPLEDEVKALKKELVERYGGHFEVDWDWHFTGLNVPVKVTWYTENWLPIEKKVLMDA